MASGEDARTVFGSTTERVTATQDDSSLAVSVLFGSVRVVVPDGVRVDPGGLVAFGSVQILTEDELRDEQARERADDLDEDEAED